MNQDKQTNDKPCPSKCPECGHDSCCDREIASLRKQLEIAMEAINRIAGTEDIESREIAKDTLSKLKGSST